MSDLATREIAYIRDQCKKRHLEEIPVAEDGNCLYTSINLGLEDIEEFKNKARINPRSAASRYILQNPTEFAPYIYGQSLSEYCEGVRGAQWGGDREITAMSRHYRVTICVIQEGQGEPLTYGEQFRKERKGNIIHIAYYKVAYGASHYTYLRRKKGFFI